MSKSIYTLDMRRDIDKGGGGSASKEYELIGEASDFGTIALDAPLSNYDEVVIQVEVVSNNIHLKKEFYATAEYLNDINAIFPEEFLWIGGGSTLGFRFNIKSVSDSSMTIERTWFAQIYSYTFKILAR